MFESIAHHDSPVSGRVWSTCLGFTGEALLIAGAAVAPLISPQALEGPQKLIVSFLPAVPLARREAPKKAPAHAVPLASATLPAERPKELFVPSRIPAAVPTIQDPPPDAGLRDSVAGGFADNGLFGGRSELAASVLREIFRTPPVVAAPARAAAAKPEPAHAPARLRVGGLVKMARPISQPMPRYPELAKSARISGAVELLAVIGVDGRIRELKVTGGNPLLVGAALEAVRRWVYEPTLLNGEPVEVVAPITVAFRLN